MNSRKSPTGWPRNWGRLSISEALREVDAIPGAYPKSAPMRAACAGRSAGDRRRPSQKCNGKGGRVGSGESAIDSAFPRGPCRSDFQTRRLTVALQNPHRADNLSGWLPAQPSPKSPLTVREQADPARSSLGHQASSVLSVISVGIPLVTGIRRSSRRESRTDPEATRH